jgi:hypothetical protein
MSIHDTVVDRYRRDPHFATLVDMLYSLIANANYTPTEIREAVMLAQIRVEERRLPRAFIIPIRALDGM